MTIEPGWWLVPLAISIGLWVWVTKAGSKGSQGSYGPDSSGFFEVIGATIGTLFVWLVWALLT